ncbi:MAG: hypothetical protein HFH82_09210 [Lachnospiraceae bacterium]|nr:hypothetical protein [Lachnospiraceae bacterium]
MRNLKLWFMTIEICLGSLFMLSSCAKSTASEETMNETSESHSGVWATSMTDSEKTDDLFQVEKVRLDTEDGSIQYEIAQMPLLVAIDNSGSMAPTETVIQEAMKVIQELLVIEDTVFSSAEYLLFNGAEDRLLSVNEISAIEYRGETSVCRSFSEINDWIEKQLEIDGEAENAMGMIIFSDLFSSRTTDNLRYDEQSAQEEQGAIDEMVGRWYELVKKGVLNVCLITWESMTEGENRDMTIDNDNMTEFGKGFQVVAEDFQKYQLDFEHIEPEDRNLNLQQESELLGQCLEKVIRVVTGLDELKWKDRGEITKGDDGLRFKIEDSLQVFVRIDLAAKKGFENLVGEDVSFQISDAESKEEYPVSCLHSGAVTNIYLIENVKEGKVYVEPQMNMEYLDCTIYSLSIPQIEISAKMSSNVKKPLSTGDVVDIILKSDCGQRDIRWKSMGQPLTIRIEIVDKESKEKVYDKLFEAALNEKFSVVPKQKGDFKLSVYFVNPEGTEKYIGGATLNIK